MIELRIFGVTGRSRTIFGTVTAEASNDAGGPGLFSASIVRNRGAVAPDTRSSAAEREISWKGTCPSMDTAAVPRTPRLTAVDAAGRATSRHRWPTCAHHRAAQPPCTLQAIRAAGRAKSFGGALAHARPTKADRDGRKRPSKWRFNPEKCTLVYLSASTPLSFQGGRFLSMFRILKLKMG